MHGLGGHVIDPWTLVSYMLGWAVYVCLLAFLVVVVAATLSALVGLVIRRRRGEDEE